VATGGAEGAAYSIEDDLSLASMSQPTHLSDPHVAMYVIGEPLTAAGTKVGFTRFSTSPNVPTWVNVKTTTGLPTSCIAGSVMSNSTGVSGSSLWICTGNVWVNVK
jgi:hypothetical protein